MSKILKRKVTCRGTSSEGSEESRRAEQERGEGAHSGDVVLTGHDHHGTSGCHGPLGLVAEQKEEREHQENIP